MLVVEDDELVRMATVDMLRQLGHEVAEAGTGYDALDALRQRKDIDVLITDLGLPGMSGQELVAAAHALRPTLPILLATGYRWRTRAPEGRRAARQAVQSGRSAERLANLDRTKPEDATVGASLKRRRPPDQGGPASLGARGSALELEILRRAFAVFPANEFVSDPLAVAQAIQTGALDSGNVHECVGAAIIGLDEAIALGGVEPFNGTGGLQGRPRSA